MTHRATFRSFRSLTSIITLTSLAFPVALVAPAVGARAADSAGDPGAPAAPAMPFLHPLFASDMVLQRDVEDPVWGWTDPGKQVTVTFNGKTATATAGRDGRWVARIGPFPAGGPYELTVAGPEQKQAKLTNVLVGDVWVCSGQSNMEMGIGGVTNGPAEIAAADHPQLRLFTVPKKIAYQPQPLPRTEPPAGEESRWLDCTPKNILVGEWNGFSAVGYFFGRDLQAHLKVPVGLIHTSWGGTVAEAWTSGEALEQMPDFREAVQALREPGKNNLSLAERMERWYAQHDPGSAGAAGPGQAPAWAGPGLGDGDWKTMTLPVYWEQAGLPDFDGIVWFRREVTIPDAWSGKELVLHLGPIDDRDTTWVNGTRVGGLDDYNVPRDYKVPAGAVKGGKLVIAVRVLDTGGGGGIWGKPEQMSLDLAGDANANGSGITNGSANGTLKPISLAGEWKYKDSTPLAKSGQPPAVADNNPNVPTVLYNGMVSPLVPFAIKGAIWYQGESNASRANQYRTLLPTMIKDWRGRFTSADGQFPFLIVQLAAFMDEAAEPGESQWAELREAQQYAARKAGHSAIAVATDIGEAKDIHPHNKQEVGRRLALDAEALAYGEAVEYSGPAFKDMEVKGNTAVLHFDHLGGGLEARGGGAVKGFAIAADDKKFAWADAKIEGDTVVVSSPRVTNPTVVRYAWENNPQKANLFNRAGLPAPPFRTDEPK